MIYRASLTPESAFMFLGENFYESEKKKYFESTSMNLPQASTIFGMLKEEILKASKLDGKELYKYNFKYTKSELKLIKELIGSFNLGGLEHDDYGKLSKVSTLYFKQVIKDNKLRGGEVTKFYQRYYLEKWDTSKEKSILNRQGCPVLASSFEELGLSRNPKVSSTSKLVELGTGKEELKLDEILVSYKQSHRAHEYSGHKKIRLKNDSNFFVDEYYTLEKGFSFVFDFEIDCDLNFENKYVRIGTKSNIFKFEVEKIEASESYSSLVGKTDKFSNYENMMHLKEKSVIITSSNTIIDPDLNCTIIGEKCSYRSISKYQVDIYDNVAVGKLAKTNNNVLYQMIMPGSLIMFKDTNYKVCELCFGVTYIKSEKKENK